MEGISWNIKNYGLTPSKSGPQPIKQIWGELENKLDRSIVHSNESLWLELQKAWDNVSVEVLRKYIDTMPERYAAVIAAKVDIPNIKVKTGK